MADIKTNIIIGARDDTGRAFRSTREGVRGISDEVKVAKRQLIGFVAAYASLQTGKKIISIADSYTQMNSQLKLVTDSQIALNAAQQRTYQIAQDTRQGLESTVNLYARLSRSTEGLNVSQGDLLTTTKAINQSFVISGSTAEEAGASITQLSQGLAAGALRGEEFNSVSEQAPRIMQALSESLGKTRGELREMAKQGELTTEVILGALLEQADAIDSEFSQMEVTVGQATTRLSNSVTQFIGVLNEGSEATAGIAGAIDVATEVVDNLGEVFRLQQQPIDDTTDSMNNFVDDTATMADNLTSIIATVVDVYGSGFHTISVGFEALGETFGAGGAQLVALFQGRFDDVLQIGELWKNDMSDLFEEGIDFDTSKYRDKLAEVTLGNDLDALMKDQELYGLSLESTGETGTRSMEQILEANSKAAASQKALAEETDKAKEAQERLLSLAEDYRTSQADAVQILDAQIQGGERAAEITRRFIELGGEESRITREQIAADYDRVESLKQVAEQKSLAADYRANLAEEIQVLEARAQGGERAAEITRQFIELGGEESRITREQIAADYDRVESLKKVAEQKQITADYVKSLDAEATYMQDVIRYGEEEASIRAEINRAKEDGVQLSADEIRTRLENIEAYKTEIEAQETFRDNLWEVSEALVGVIGDTENFADSMVSILEDMLKRMAALAIYETIAGLFGMGSSPDGSANYGDIIGQVFGSIGNGGNNGNNSSVANFGGAAGNALGAYGSFQQGQNAESTEGKVLGYGMSAYQAYNAYTQIGEQIGKTVAEETAKQVATQQAQQTATTQVLTSGTTGGATAATAASGYTSAGGVATGATAGQTGVGGTAITGYGGGSTTAAGSSSASGAAAGGAIVAAMYALSAWSEHGQKNKRETAAREFSEFEYRDAILGGQHARIRTDATSERLKNQTFVAGLNGQQSFIADAAGLKRQGSNFNVMGEDGKYWQQFRGDIEKAQDALKNFSPEIEAFQARQREAAEKQLSRTMRQGDVEGELLKLRKEQAAAVVESQDIVAAAHDQAASAIVEAFGSISTTQEMVVQAIEDGFISASEAAAAGLDHAAIGMISNLDAVRSVAEAAGVAVASVGEASRGRGEGVGAGPEIIRPRDKGRQPGDGKALGTAGQFVPVPAGYSNDSYTLGLQSGEDYLIRTPADRARGVGEYILPPTAGLPGASGGGRIRTSERSVSDAAPSASGGGDVVSILSAIDQKLAAIERNTSDTASSTRSGAENNDRRFGELIDEVGYRQRHAIRRSGGAGAARPLSAA